MDTDSEINTLKLFNEKVDKLSRLSFMKTLLKNKSVVTLKGERKENDQWELTQERVGPQEEAVDAFVLTIRFFIQDNESTSFRNIADLYDNSCLSYNLKSDFKHLRSNLNRYLDSYPFMGISVNKETLTHRKIMDTVIYGGLSHANPIKKREYDFWVNTPLKAFIEEDFVYSLGIIYKALIRIKEVNLKAIDEIQNSQN